MSKSGPLVSVVMPSFNQDEFIEAAVRSVLEQDYQPLELMVMDGGSTDGTLQCLERLSAEFGNKLRWVSEKDAGPADAINKALKLARGEIIGWLNSDDLYAPQAVSRAAGYFANHPDAVMVYGEGEHVDVNLKSLGRYPTRPPSAGIQAFQEGCFICQPTVFLRSCAFNTAGYLDESLSTAFDFEWWLRMFKFFPDQIGFIDATLALSRLHSGGITLRMRKLVAMEGMRVLAQHVGTPSPNWLLTYVDELCATFPFGGGVTDLRAHLAELVAEAKPFLGAQAAEQLSEKLANDARLRTALPGIFANIYADGWAPATLEVRILKSSASPARLRICCAHASPVDSWLALRVTTSWGSEDLITVDNPGLFDIVVDLPESSIGDSLVVTVMTDNAFIPSHVDPGSSDDRRLAFMLDKLTLEG